MLLIEIYNNAFEFVKFIIQNIANPDTVKTAFLIMSQLHLHKVHKVTLSCIMYSLNDLFLISSKLFALLWLLFSRQLNSSLICQFAVMRLSIFKTTTFCFPYVSLASSYISFHFVNFPSHSPVTVAILRHRPHHHRHHQSLSVSLEAQNSFTHLLQHNDTCILMIDSSPVFFDLLRIKGELTHHQQHLHKMLFFLEVAQNSQNSLSFPRSEKSLSIPGFPGLWSPWHLLEANMTPTPI